MEPNWRDGKGSILYMVSTSIIEDGESIKSGSEMQK